MMMGLLLQPGRCCLHLVSVLLACWAVRAMAWPVARMSICGALRRHAWEVHAAMHGAWWTMPCVVHGPQILHCFGGQMHTFAM
jgi:hypothetical protein